jgi:hypothetical protein
MFSSPWWIWWVTFSAIGTEQAVPLLLNRRTDVPASASLRNFDIYDLALNHALAAA